MATLSLGAAGLLTATPVGWALGIAAAVVDQSIIIPGLFNEDADEVYGTKLASLPAVDQGPGAPRTFVIGRQMRVPVHVLYQSLKAREETSGGGKGGTSVSVRRVFVDALLHLNDRPVREMVQLIASGKLVLFNERDIIRITSHRMTISQIDVSGEERLLISMPDDLEPSFTDTFKVKDLVRLRDFVKTSGPNADQINGKLFVVTALTDSTPVAGSTMTLQTCEGQTITDAVYTSGTVFSPAATIRVDSELGGPFIFVKNTDIGTASNNFRLVMLESALGNPQSVGPQSVSSNSTHTQAPNVFQPGDDIEIEGHSGGTTLRFFIPRVEPHIPDALVLDPDGPTQTALSMLDEDENIPAASGRFLRAFKPAGQNKFSPGLFNSGFDPEDHFNDGDDLQAQPDLLVDTFGAGETGNYRGQATQGLEQMSLSPFGDQLPPNMEAIITVDEDMSVGQAVESLMQRAGILNSEVNTDQVAQDAFLGTFFRGSASVASQLQTILMAYQLLVQERDGVLCVFNMNQCDLVSIDNGDAFSDLGAFDENQPSSRDKVSITDKPQTDLPTSVGVKFQDPDAAYSMGYEHFGLRNPRPSPGTTGSRAIEHIKDVNVNLSQVVLQRRDARNLAATVLARAWTNQRVFDLELPAAYLYLLENDLVTFTDDDGEVIEARVVKREVGQNYIVKVQAIEERSGLSVTGSAVQSSSTVVPQTVPPNVSTVQLGALDMVGFDADSIADPSILLDLRTDGTVSTATLFESKDGGSYLPVGTFSGSAQQLLLLGDLAAQDPSETYGTTSVSFRSQTVLATLISTDPSAPLATAPDQDAVKAGQNWCAIERPDGTVELAAFETVSTSNGLTTLGSWLRGIRGTSSAVCPAGSKVTMLFQAQGGLVRRVFSGPKPTTLSYKVVPAGALLADATVANGRQVDIATPLFRNALPLPVRQVFRSYNAATGTRFSLEDSSGVPTHWSRELLPLGAQPPHTLDEPVEHYLIKFYQEDATAPFPEDKLADTALLRADPSTGSPTLRDRFFDYPDTRATAAGYTPGSSETYNIGVIQVGQHGQSPEAQFTV